VFEHRALTLPNMIRKATLVSVPKAVNTKKTLSPPFKETSYSAYIFRTIIQNMANIYW